MFNVYSPSTAKSHDLSLRVIPAHDLKNPLQVGSRFQTRPSWCVPEASTHMVQRQAFDPKLLCLAGIEVIAGHCIEDVPALLGCFKFRRTAGSVLAEGHTGRQKP